METAAHSLMEQARALGETVARDNDPHHGQTLSADRAYTVGEAALVEVHSWLMESDPSIGARRPAATLVLATAATCGLGVSYLAGQSHRTFVATTPVSRWASSSAPRRAFAGT